MSLSLSPIFTGVWTDHSRGPILGATLTLTTTWGQVVISAATVMVQLAGVAVWAIVAFFLHQYQAKDEPKDEFAAQQSVILRNSGPIGTIVESIFLAKAWYHHTSRPWPRILHMAAIALLIHIGFLVAGLSVTYIVYDPRKSFGLIVSKYCGFTTTNLSTTQAFALSETPSAKWYAQQCYYLEGLIVDCNSTFAKSRLYPSFSGVNASCPVGPGACSTGDHGAALISIALNSQDDLGINASPNDRVVLQYNMTCSSLNHSVLETFSTGQQNPTTQINGTEYKTIKYVFGDHPTFQYSYNQIFSSGALGGASYDVKSFTYQPELNSLPGGSSSQGVLYSPLNQTQFDLVTVLISPIAMSYTGPSNDSVFGTTAQPYTNSNEANLYRPAQNTSAIVCTQSYAACNPVNSKCTDWTGYQALYYAVTKAYLPKDENPWKDTMTPLGINAAQNASLYRMLASMKAAYLPIPLNSYPSLLTMTQIVQGTTSLPLDDYQWVQEVAFWWETVMAAIQQTIQDWASNLEQTALAYNITKPTDPALASQCSQQIRMLPNGYQNFSLFGILFILVVSILAILAAAIIRSEYARLPKRKVGEKNHVKALAWWSDGTLQLHRRALEGVGVDGWLTRRDTDFESVPVVDRARKRVRVPTGLTWENEIPSDGKELKGKNSGFSLPLDLSKAKSVSLRPSDTSVWRPVAQQDFEDVPKKGNSPWSTESDQNTIR